MTVDSFVSRSVPADGSTKRGACPNLATPRPLLPGRSGLTMRPTAPEGAVRSWDSTWRVHGRQTPASRT